MRMIFHQWLNSSIDICKEDNGVRLGTAILSHLNHWNLFQLPQVYQDVSENSGTPKSSILIGFSIINHPFWGTPIFGNTHQGLPISFHHNQKSPCLLTRGALNHGVEGFLRWRTKVSFRFCEVSHEWFAKIAKTTPFFPCSLPPKYINVVDLVHG